MILQTNDRYASPLIGGRYQVLASSIGSTFYVWDHDRGDTLRTEWKEIRRFAQIIEALSFLGFTGAVKEDSECSSAVGADITQGTKMAKAAKVSEAMVKAQASMEKRVAAKRAALPKEVKAVKAVKSPPTPKVVEAAPPPPAPKAEAKRGRAISTSGTMAARIRQLVSDGKTNEEITEIVRREYRPNVPAGAAQYYREH